MPLPSSSSNSPNGGGEDPGRHRPRMSLRVRNMAEGVVYHLVFEGDVRRLSGRQLRHHLAHICHIPPAEQQLFVRGERFTADMLGAAVGLQQEDIVDLMRGEPLNERDPKSNSSISVPAAVGLSAGRNGRRSRSIAATASSLRPSTDAGTLSPEAPNDNDDDAYPRRGRTHPHTAAGTAMSYVRGAAAAHPTSSVGSTATTNTRKAPSPERLVEQQEQSRRPHPSPRPSPQQRQQGRQQHYDGSMQDDSKLPLWTSATTLSSFSGSRRDRYDAYNNNNGQSPRPQAPPHYKAPPHSTYPSPPQPQPLNAEPSPNDSSVFYSANHRRPSYEVPLPHQHQQRQQQRQQQLQQQQQGCGARNGLNQSRMEHVRGASPLSFSSSPPLPTYSSSFFDANDTASQRGGAVAAARTPQARYVPVCADDLEMLLDEQDYIWRMEEYRFRTERLNRLTALQNHQRELAFEATRYDQAVAVVSSQLQRERRKLAELQEAMSHHTDSLNRFSRLDEKSHMQHGLSSTDGGEEEDDHMSEVIDVDV